MTLECKANDMTHFVDIHRAVAVERAWRPLIGWGQRDVHALSFLPMCRF